MSNLFLNEDGLRAYTEEVKEEISKTVGELPEFASEQIAEDYESSTTGGTNIIFSFNADKYEKVVFTAYVEGSAGASGSMQFDLLNYPDNTSSNGETVMNLAKFSITPVSGRLEEYVEIDCSGLSGSYTVKSSGGGNASIMFGATDIKAIAKDAENVTDALNYLDAKIGDITKLDSILIQEEWSGKADSSGYIVCCTFDATDLNRIEFDGGMKFEGSGGGMVTFWLCEGTNPTPQIQIGSISEGGTQKEEVGRHFVYDVSAMTGTCSLIATGSLTACVKNLIGHRGSYTDVVTAVNKMMSTTQERTEKQLGDISGLGTVTAILPASGEFGAVGNNRHSYATLDMTSVISLRITAETIGSGATFEVILIKKGMTPYVVSLSGNEKKTIEIDCADLTGTYTIETAATNESADGTVKWSDFTAQIVAGTDIISSINNVNKRTDISDFGSKTRLAYNRSAVDVVGWEKLTTVNLTGVDFLSFAVTVFCESEYSYNICIAPAGELPSSRANEIFFRCFRSNGWNREKCTVPASEYSGDYDIYIVGDGSGRSIFTLSDICSFIPIQVNDIADALNYLLSLHN